MVHTLLASPENVTTLLSLQIEAFVKDEMITCTQTCSNPRAIEDLWRHHSRSSQARFHWNVREKDVPYICHFIPHHAVKKQSATTPVRIVYDCSCRQSPCHHSLNNCLQVGPPFLIDLCTLLLHFRSHKFTLVTDIEKAFLHVQLAEGDRSYTCFLWLSEPDNPESQFTIYRFKVVLFGSVSSPFMLHAALRYHLTTEKSTTASDILANLYVDNVVSGCSNETRAL